MKALGTLTRELPAGLDGAPVNVSEIARVSVNLGVIGESSRDYPEYRELFCSCFRALFSKSRQSFRYSGLVLGKISESSGHSCRELWPELSRGRRLCIYDREKQYTMFFD